MICLVHQKVKKNIKKSGYSNCIKNDSHKSLVYCIICLPSLISCIWSIIYLFFLCRTVVHSQWFRNDNNNINSYMQRNMQNFQYLVLVHFANYTNEHGLDSYWLSNLKLKILISTYILTICKINIAQCNIIFIYYSTTWNTLMGFKSIKQSNLWFLNIREIHFLNFNLYSSWPSSWNSIDWNNKISLKAAFIFGCCLEWRFLVIYLFIYFLFRWGELIDWSGQLGRTTTIFKYNDVNLPNHLVIFVIEFAGFFHSLDMLQHFLDNLTRNSFEFGTKYYILQKLYWRMHIIQQSTSSLHVSLAEKKNRSYT